MQGLTYMYYIKIKGYVFPDIKISKLVSFIIIQ